MHEGRKGSAEDELLCRIDDLLSGGKHDAGIRSRAVISLELCELIKTSLDSLQLRAFEVATQYWHGPSPSDEDRMELATEIAKRCDQDVQEGRNEERGGCINRLLWNALNVNTGLDSFAAELLIEIAIGSGLNSDQIETAFSRVISELKELRPARSE